MTDPVMYKLAMLLLELLTEIWKYFPLYQFWLLSGNWQL